MEPKYDNSHLCAFCTGAGMEADGEVCKPCQGTGIERQYWAKEILKLQEKISNWEVKIKAHSEY